MPNEIKPLPFDIIPEGRGKIDKLAYKFVRWQMRKNRKQIQANIEQMQHDLLVYGRYAMIDGRVVKMENIFLNKPSVLTAGETYRRTSDAE